MATCNHCELERVKRAAEKRGDRVHLKPNTNELFPEAQDVYIEPASGGTWRWVAWFAAINPPACGAHPRQPPG